MDADVQVISYFLFFSLETVAHRMAASRVDFPFALTLLWKHLDRQPEVGVPDDFKFPVKLAMAATLLLLHV